MQSDRIFPSERIVAGCAGHVQSDQGLFLTLQSAVSVDETIAGSDLPMRSKHSITGNSAGQ